MTHKCMKILINQYEYPQSVFEPFRYLLHRYCLFHDGLMQLDSIEYVVYIESGLIVLLISLSCSQIAYQVIIILTSEIQTLLAPFYLTFNLYALRFKYSL